MKFFIVGMHCSGKQEILDILENHDVNCGRQFSNLSSPSNQVYNSYNYELYDMVDINEIFENNAYIFINELDSYSNLNSYKYYEGLSKYEFDNNDVFSISPDQLLHISKKNINDDVCFIWVDNNKEDRLNRYRSEKREYSFSSREEIEKKDINTFIKTIYNFNKSKVLYFVNEEPGRVAAVIYSLVKHPELIDIYAEYYN
jgi:hypothetical protein